jgi:hypothetical protein
MWSVGRMLTKLDRRPGKISQTAKNGPILAVSCKWSFIHPLTYDKEKKWYYKVFTCLMYLKLLKLLLLLLLLLLRLRPSPILRRRKRPRRLTDRFQRSPFVDDSTRRILAGRRGDAISRNPSAAQFPDELRALVRIIGRWALRRALSQRPASRILGWNWKKTA